MDCPRCETPPALIEVKLDEDVVVDACKACKGIYFDKDELGTFLQLSKDLPEYKTLLATAKPSFPCPKCKGQMKELNYVKGQDLAVDHCEACEGVWLDGGEIGEARAMADAQDIPKIRMLRSLWDLRRSVRGIAKGCPKCDGKVEAFKVDERVTLDMCGKCHGLWFDKGEIKEYFELQQDIPDLDQALASARDTGVACKMCDTGGQLVEMEYSPVELESGKLHIDYCKGCAGIWIDNKEWVMLECLIAQASESPQARLGRAVKKLQDAGYQVL